MDELLLYVGTYTHTDSEGIYLCRMDTSTGAVEVVEATPGVENPSFLIVDAARNRLFAVGEVSEYEGLSSGSVASFSIDPGTGGLTLLSSRPTGGPGTCHLDIDEGGCHIFVANYEGGSVSVFPVESDGTLGAASDFVQHEGSSVNPERQQEPHAHSINLDPAGRHALVPDLGTDRVVIYRVDSEAGKLSADVDATVDAAPGAGPRHLDFHPNGRWVYVINEIGSTLAAYGYDAASGALTHVQTESTLPADFDGRSHTADVHVHPSGRYVYGSNRGHDSVAIFAIDPPSGRLTPAGHQSTGGRTPRNFAIDPTGTFLLAANQDTDNIVTFRIDADTGALEPMGHEVSVPMPVCLKFFQR